MKTTSKSKNNNKTFKYTLLTSTLKLTNENENEKENKNKKKTKKKKNEKNKNNEILNTLNEYKEFEKEDIKNNEKLYEMHKQKYLKQLKLKKQNEEERKKKEKAEQKERINKIKNLSNEILKSNDLQISKKNAENILSFGSLMKIEIEKEKKDNPEKFLDIEEIIKNENNDYFSVGILAKTLEEQGITVAVEKNSSDENLTDSSLRLLINELGSMKKIVLDYDYGDEQNNKVINDPEEREKFTNEQILQFSKILKLKPSQFSICNIRNGSIKTDLIFHDPLLNLNENFSKLFQKIKDFSKESQNLKNVTSSSVLEGLKFSSKMFDVKGNRIEGWGENEKRGGREYDPPKGWIGHGISVSKKYDNGDDTWLGYTGEDNGEWCVAYHGTNINYALSIMENGLKSGVNQVYSDSDDINHPGEKVGDGIYVTPLVSIADGYALRQNPSKYKCIFMCRVNPRTIRIPEDNQDYWVVKGGINDIRPYRLLIQEVKNDNEDNDN